MANNRTQRYFTELAKFKTLAEAIDEQNIEQIEAMLASSSAVAQGNELSIELPNEVKVGDMTCERPPLLVLLLHQQNDSSEWVDLINRVITRGENPAVRCRYSIPNGRGLLLSLIEIAAIFGAARALASLI